MYKVTLEAARVNAHLSQREAAKKLSISNKTLCKWENGASYPPANKLAEMCVLYAVPYDNLIFCSINSL